MVPTGGATGGGSTTYYTLTATAGGGGKIAPSGKVRVSRNSDKTFTVTPGDGYEIADVLVDGKSVGAVDSYTFERVRANHTIAASFQAEGQRPVWYPFADVKEDAWYYDSVKDIYERGLMNGTSKTTFSPELATTRGMIVTILWRLEQEPESGAAMSFTDVTAGSYCFDAVRWAAEHEIVKGYTATAFGPADTITRQELAAILYRYARYKGADVSAADDLAAFTDRPDGWAEDAVKWAVGAGVLSGKGSGVLDPKGRATRAEVAAMLHRFLSNTAN
ncbi:S-layer homology domain-containing protein [Agathobaculum sp. NTUH-O15-33]|uniref:S-layer homology domain-containing protein n=1 Tax=Agathobaculum sp. NTUH-O15-33 TaxID=3079302 RepID=UPI003FA4B07D